MLTGTSPKKCPKNNVEAGAQDISGLWRIYPANCSAHDKLLTEGISLRGHSLSLYDKNPFILRGKDGTESPFTKLWISDIPISCDDKDNVSTLVRLGCVLPSSLILEKMHNRDGKLKS